MSIALYLLHRSLLLGAMGTKHLQLLSNNHPKSEYLHIVPLHAWLHRQLRFDVVFCAGEGFLLSY